MLSRIGYGIYVEQNGLWQVCGGKTVTASTLGSKGYALCHVCVFHSLYALRQVLVSSCCPLGGSHRQVLSATMTVTGS